ncbi:MAG TPA: hypothetical protein VNF47_10400 [Streptosporangiaceae bacterium]|nr:hypothetical protein [Streptosporangiaceae bacterium]
MPGILHDPATATTATRVRVPEPADSGPVRTTADGSASSCQRPRRHEARQSRPAVTGARHAGRFPVSRRPAGSAGNSRDDRHAATEADAEAAVTVTAIAGLRQRLRCQATLKHPAVRRELSKLEEQLADHLERAGHVPGRHRAPASPADSITPNRPEARDGDDALARDGDDAQAEAGEPGLRPGPATASAS